MNSEVNELRSGLKKIETELEQTKKPAKGDNFTEVFKISFNMILIFFFFFSNQKVFFYKIFSLTIVPFCSRCKKKVSRSRKNI